MIAYIRITEPEPAHNNYGLEGFSDGDPELIKRAEQFCSERLMDLDLDHIRQGRSNQWVYFEFFKTTQKDPDSCLILKDEKGVAIHDPEKQDQIVQLALDLSEEIGLSVLTEKEIEEVWEKMRNHPDQTM